MMNYIKGFCYTNLDNYDCSLVDMFYGIPKEGDRIQVLYKGNVTTLQVCKITHGQTGNVPEIVLELNK